MGALIPALLWHGLLQAADMNAKEILDRIDDIWRGNSSRAVFTMKIHTRHWDRNLTMQSHSLGKDYSLIVIQLPEKERGTTTLKVKNDIWNYLPKVDRSIKIPPSMLLSAWMGSHFTNDDLVKESRMSEDYTYKVSFEGKRRGEEIYELTLVPKPNAPVVWGKIEVEVRKVDYMPLVELYYDEKGKVARRSTFGDFKMMGGKMIPAQMTIAPESSDQEYTTIITQKIEFDLPIKEDFFSLSRLKSK